MNALKQWLFSRSLKRRVARLPRPGAARSWNALNSVGLLFDASSADRRKWASATIESWRRAGKQVTVLAYLAKPADENHIPFPWYCPKDLDWLGRPKPETVSQFLNHRVDLLVYPEYHLPPHFEYLLSLSKADVKAGYHMESTHQLLNLQIDLSGRDLPHLLMQDIQQLLSTIRHQTLSHEPAS